MDGVDFNVLPYPEMFATAIPEYMTYLFAVLLLTLVAAAYVKGR